MKTKLTLVALIILAAGLVGCSQDADQGNIGILSTVSAGIGEGGTSCTTLWAGQNIDAGTVCVRVIDEGANEEICITFNTTGGWELVETHLWFGADIDDMPATKKGNPKIGNFPHYSGDITGATTWEVCIPLSEWGTELDDGTDSDLCGMILYAAAHASLQLNDGDGNIIQTETGWAGGDDIRGRSWATYFSVGLSCGDGYPPVVGDCETAFAYGCEAYAKCFIDLADLDDPYDSLPARWGWTNGPLAAGTYSFDIYSGAGQCDLTNGALVGMLTVDYDGSVATVTYNTYAGYVMEELHLYVGHEEFPRDNQGDFTVAPGSLGHTWGFDIPVSEYVYSVGGFTGEAIHVIAHAVVCGDSDMIFDPVCDPPCDEWIVYGSNLNGGTDPFDDAIYAYDLKSETKTLVYDPTPIDNDQNYPNANAYDAVNKRIYFGTNDGRLYYHEIDSGIHVQVEGDDVSGSFGTMACGSWYNGKFYYVQNGTNKLYAVSVVADVATRALVGTVPVTAGYGDIAFDPANPGRFIGSAIGTATDGKWYWYDVNTNTSANLTEGGDSLNHKQLAYGSDGVLYGVNAVGGEFYSIVYSVTDSTITLTGAWESPYTFTDLASGPQCQ